ncbi:conserved hypothetical protein [Ricinus communis]|uniref:Uncharacterized protein n=1 Tax=Ricinus communis TaxID=3988 RepID=B9SYK2_RICCO|nr:conserved hypothetical protein [Ricinus communis]
MSSVSYIVTVKSNSPFAPNSQDQLLSKICSVSQSRNLDGLVAKRKIGTSPAAHKAGIDPHSLRRNRIGNIQSTSSTPANGFAVSSGSSGTSHDFRSPRLNCSFSW